MKGPRSNGRPSNAQRQRVWNRDKYVCQYCDLDGLQKFVYHWMMHVDHLLPLSAGGGNGEENLVTACVICNSLKAGKHPPEPIMSKQALLSYYREYIRQRRTESESEFVLRRKKLGYAIHTK